MASGNDVSTLLVTSQNKRKSVRLDVNNTFISRYLILSFSETNLENKERIRYPSMEGEVEFSGLFSFRWILFRFPEIKRDQSQKGVF